MTSRELGEWMAYERVEPFGYDPRRDAQQATIAWLLARTQVRKGRTIRLADFMQVREVKKRQGLETMIQILKGVAVRAGGVIRKGKHN